MQNIFQIPPESIRVRPDRQRTKMEEASLKALETSIHNVGLLNPLVVEPAATEVAYYLVAGERRLTAIRNLMSRGELPKDFLVPVTCLANLDNRGRQLIELEENIKREDLNWIDRVKAVAKVVSFFPDESYESIASRLGFSASKLTYNMVVYENLSKPQVQAASGLTNAYNICVKETRRQMDNVLADVGALFQLEAKEPEITRAEGNTSPTPDLKPITIKVQETKSQAQAESSPHRILQADFFEWVKNYSGPAFNFLHLDFPYGIRHDKSQAGNTAHYGTYEDTEDLYKSLCEGLFSNPALIAPSVHVLCWLSLNYLDWTKALFASHGFECHLQPLIWHKTDNKGIIGDTTCGFRNTGEYALFFNRGRKPLRQAVANICDCPTIKSFHASEKPLPMLKHFFKAFIDSSSRVLDPTCGSGTSIRAAADAGAEFSVGLELDADFAKKAQEALTAHLLTSNLEIS